MTPIKFQRLVVTRLCRLGASLLAIDIPKMPDDVRQHERFVNLAEENNGFLIALSGHSTILASRRLTSPPEFLCTRRQVDSIRVRSYVSLLDGEKHPTVYETY